MELGIIVTKALFTVLFLSGIYCFILLAFNKLTEVNEEEGEDEYQDPSLAVFLLYLLPVIPLGVAIHFLWAN